MTGNETVFLFKKINNMKYINNLRIYLGGFNLKPNSFRWTNLVLVFLFAILFLNELKAASIQWTGGTSSDFEVGGNWTGGASPSNSLTIDTANFSGSPSVNQPTLSVKRSVQGLVFSTPTGGWTLGGSSNSLTIGTGGIDASAQTSGTTTINSNLSYGSNLTFKVGSGGTLLINGSIDRTGGSLTFGSSTSTGTIELAGTGTTAAQIVAGGGTLYLNRTITSPYNGLNGLTISGGTVKIGGSDPKVDPNADQIGNVRTVIFSANNGALDLNGHNESIAALNVISGTGNVVTNSAANTTSVLTLNGTSGVNTFTGTIQDGAGGGVLGLTVNVTAKNPGTQVLTGDNTYSGGTIVSKGTLLVNNTVGSGTGTGAVTVSGGTFGGSGSVSGPVNLSGTATLLAGDGTVTANTLSLSNGLTMGNSTILEFSLSGAGNHSTLANTGTSLWTFAPNQIVTFLDFGAQSQTTYSGLITGIASDPGVSNWTVQNSGWINGTFSYNASTQSVDFSAVPEPSSFVWITMIFGIALLLYRRPQFSVVIN